jgi:dephospho-CoA kinase
LKRKKPIIGLCGGIGAGKSQVAEVFERCGCLVISSDRLNHEVLREPEVLAALVSWWGEAVVDAAGGPRRERIAEIVFEDPEQKARLEELVYPLIARRRAAMIGAVEDNSAIKAIVLDSPLLFESNLDHECDSVVFVHASEARRIQRLWASRGWDAEELRRRERWQLSLALKRTRSDFVVDNDGPTEDLYPQVTDILRAIVARCSDQA